VVCGLWKEEPSLREVLRMVETNEIYVVPHLVTEGYFTQKSDPGESCDSPVQSLGAMERPSNTVNQSEAIHG